MARKLIDFKKEKVHGYGPPEGGGWVWLPRDLLQSDAWRYASINVRPLIDFLLIEHMKHAGKENGLLLAPSDASQTSHDASPTFHDAASIFQDISGRHGPTMRAADEAG